MDKELRELLETGVGFISYILNHANDIVARLQEGQGNAIISQLSSFIDDIQTLLEAVETAQAKGVAIQTDTFNTRIADMLDAVENQDYNLLADVIDYDLTDQLNEWREAFVKATE